jgi:hypothetical protein
MKNPSEQGPLGRTVGTESLVLASCLLLDGSPSMSESHSGWPVRGSSSGQVRAPYDSSALGLAPFLFRSVLGFRSVRLGDVLSGTKPQGSGSDPGSSSMGLIGSRSVRLGHGLTGSNPSF